MLEPVSQGARPLGDEGINWASWWKASEQILGQLLGSEISISALDPASQFLGTLHVFLFCIIILVPLANFSSQTAAASL